MLLAAQEAMARREDPLPVETSIGFTKTTEGHQIHPNLPGRFVTNARRRLVAADSVSVTHEFVGEIGGETQVLGYLTSTFDDVPMLAPTATPMSQAPCVLLRAMERIARLGCSPPLPEYLIDCELIAWLIERVSFDGGGGSKGKLSGASIERLLADPVALAEEVESYSQRHGERLTDREAGEAERGYAKIVERIRACGQRNA
jgi:hypothetical protein